MSLDNIHTLILKPLQKIKVIRGVGIIKEESIGYISRVRILDTTTLLIDIYFSRYGKKGKPRVTTGCLRVMPIQYDQLDNDMLNKLNELYGDFTFVEAIYDSSKDVRDLDVYDFICYLQAFSLFICSMNVDAHVGNFISRNNANTALYYLENIHSIPTYAFHSFIQTVFKVKTVFDSQVITYFNDYNNRSFYMHKFYKELAIYKTLLPKYVGKIKAYCQTRKENLVDVLSPPRLVVDNSINNKIQKFIQEL